MVYLPDVPQTGAHNILFILALASSFIFFSDSTNWIYVLCTFLYVTADAFVLVKKMFKYKIVIFDQNRLSAAQYESIESHFFSRIRIVFDV